MGEAMVVEVFKDGLWFHCLCLPNPVRWKCGNCGAGVVAYADKKRSRKKCRVCHAVVAVRP